MRFADHNVEDIHLGFSNCIARLETSVADVPPGWHEIYLDCIRSLHAVDCATRSSVELGTPVACQGMLQVQQIRRDSASPDPVVDGLLRKLREKSACTCQLCGRRGWLQRGRSLAGTYCADCWVPRELRTELGHWLEQMSDEAAFLQTHPVVSWDDIRTSLQAVIPKESLKALNAAGRQVNYLAADQLFKLRPRFEALKQVVDEYVSMLDEAEYRWCW